MPRQTVAPAETLGKAESLLTLILQGGIGLNNLVTTGFFRQMAVDQFLPAVLAPEKSPEAFGPRGGLGLTAGVGRSPGAGAPGC